jgi:hypothetical protein
MVLTGYSALSLVTGLCCHHRQRNAARIVANLNASVGASGPHGFAVCFGIIRLVMPPHPSHPALNVRDDA